ncbi:hypothetical protein CHELA20_53075 [Hyphomicrobiales bacterium]|nr:hypothetical protein CHELA41_21850 [Hyphomicrobiales bacterium]CAH1683524.1 hypothetical protein CHELA20_53075 [Hyphomicrobiales bacterium]
MCGIALHSAPSHCNMPMTQKGASPAQVETYMLQYGAGQIGGSKTTCLKGGWLGGFHGFDGSSRAAERRWPVALSR